MKTVGILQNQTVHREKAKLELIMRNSALAVAFLTVLIAPAAAQKAEIEAANVKWMEFFSKGDFDGVASLYALDATAFPPGSVMVKGRIAIAQMERYRGALQRSESHDPRCQEIRAFCGA